MKIEVQYFNGCPNSTEMISRVKEVIRNLNENIEYKEILIGTQEEAERIKFRGSPTVLINGIDLENLQEPTEAYLACRYYKNGLPPTEEIEKFIIQQADIGN